MNDTAVDEGIRKDQFVEVIDEIDLFGAIHVVNPVDNHFRANDNLKHVVVEQNVAIQLQVVDSLEGRLWYCEEVHQLGLILACVYILQRYLEPFLLVLVGFAVIDSYQLNLIIILRSVGNEWANCFELNLLKQLVLRIIRLVLS